MFKQLLLDSSEEVYLGRDESKCKYIFSTSGAISRVHCRLFSCGHELFLEDLSSNGTFVNGRKMTKNEQRRLRHDDTVCLINPQEPESLRFTWVVDAPEAPPATSADVIGSYRVLPTILGTGNFGTVYLGEHLTTKERAAVKIIDKTKMAFSTQLDFNSLLSEANIMRKLNHRNIVRILDVVDEKRRFCIILELVSDGDFFDYVANRGTPPFDENGARCLFVQLVEALIHMHSKSVVHRDLKLENVLVKVDSDFKIPNKSSSAADNAPFIPPDKVTLKVTDFGLAKYCPPGANMRTFCGTPTYLAPEVGGSQNAYGPSVDVWSLGIILYMMLTRSMPEEPQKKPVPIPANQPPKVQDMLRRLLTRDPSHRIDLKGICAHPWLEGCNIEGRELANGAPAPQLVMQPTVVGHIGNSLAEMDMADPFGLNKSVGEKRVRTDDGPATDDETEESPKPTKEVWYWKKDLTKDDADPAAWQRYGNDDVERIVRCRSKNQKTSKVGKQGEYRISFEGMFQYSTKEPTKQRPVRVVKLD